MVEVEGKVKVKGKEKVESEVKAKAKVNAKENVNAKGTVHAKGKECKGKGMQRERNAKAKVKACLLLMNGKRWCKQFAPVVNTDLYFLTTRTPPLINTNN